MLRPAWFLNLDAELELATIGRYTQKHQVTAQLSAHLVDCDDLTAGEPVHDRDPLNPEYSVFCWSPTPGAILRLQEQGLHAVKGPDIEVLRRANHRGWTERFAPAALERRFVSERDDWRGLLLHTSAPTGVWRLKRPLGFAGRGQRRLPEKPSADDLRWVRDSLAQGGILRELDVPVLEQFSLHGYVNRSEVILGKPVQFWTNEQGAPTHFRLAPFEPEAKLFQELVQAAKAVAEQLQALEYFGPFGVDAFTWQGDAGLELNAVSDVNARFTLAWSRGMGEQRTAALRSYARG